MAEEPVKIQEGLHQVRDLGQIKSAEFQSLYASNALLAASFYDITLIFGKPVLSDKGIPVLENSVAVTMSWEHAKVLVIAMQKAIDAYEKTHGAAVRDAPKA